MPGIPMKLVALNGNMQPAIYGLVDSGADCSNFPADWAKALGIDYKADCEQSDGHTAGGLAAQYRYKPGIDAIIMGKKMHLEAVFREGLPVALLGREDFMKEYRVSFDQRSLSFRVEAYD